MWIIKFVLILNVKQGGSSFQPQIHHSLYMVTFSLGVAIAGIAGVLIGLTQALMPAMGMEWTIKALIVVLLAGIGSIAGTFFAGIILGVVEAVSAIWMGPYTMAVGMVILLVILMFRPQGLFGKA